MLCASDPVFYLVSVVYDTPKAFHFRLPKRATARILENVQRYSALPRLL